MKLKLRYDNAIQILDFDAENTEKLWLNLTIDGEGLSPAEREQLIQEAVDEQYNRPEYNSWHTYYRHNGAPGSQPGEDEDGEGRESSEPLMCEVADERVFFTDELNREAAADYEDTCQRVRSICGKKQNWADAFIAIVLDGMTVNDYAAEIGVSDASIVSKYLARAKKILQENYSKRQI